MDIPWILDFALVTLKKLASHLSVISSHFSLSSDVSLHSSHLRLIFPVSHFFTFKIWLLSLFTLVTVNMVSPPELFPELSMGHFLPSYTTTYHLMSNDKTGKLS